MTDIQDRDNFALWTTGRAGSELFTPTTERWKPIPGHGGDYEVSNLGRVRSHKGRRVQIIKQAVAATGYRRLTLSRNGVHTSRSVHQLVLEAFVGPRPDGMVTRHLNDVPYDNRLENLTWGTRAENEDDKRRNGGTQRLLRRNR